MKLPNGMVLELGVGNYKVDSGGYAGYYLYICWNMQVLYSPISGYWVNLS